MNKQEYCGFFTCDQCPFVIFCYKDNDDLVAKKDRFLIPVIAAMATTGNDNKKDENQLIS